MSLLVFVCGALILTTEGQVIQGKRMPTPRPMEASHHQWLAPSEMKWGAGPPSLPKGAKAVTLEGDMSRPGPFVARVTLPKGYRISPHTHPGTERITVVSGTYHLGMGRRFDEKRAKALPAGSFAVTPPGMEHFAFTKTGCVIQLNGFGPWDVHYLNPKDDPRAKGAR